MQKPIKQEKKKKQQQSTTKTLRSSDISFSQLQKRLVFPAYSLSNSKATSSSYQQLFHNYLFSSYTELRYLSTSLLHVEVL